MDVVFNTSKGKKWFCGTVTKVDKKNAAKVFIEFEDSKERDKFKRDDNWFDFTTERDRVRRKLVRGG